MITVGMIRAKLQGLPNAAPVRLRVRSAPGEDIEVEFFAVAAESGELFIHGDITDAIMREEAED